MGRLEQDAAVAVFVVVALLRPQFADVQTETQFDAILLVLVILEGRDADRSAARRLGSLASRPV